MAVHFMKHYFATGGEFALIYICEEAKLNSFVFSKSKEHIFIMAAENPGWPHSCPSFFFSHLNRINLS